MEKNQLNSADSLALIHRMITHTREKYERGGGTIFLIWGYTSLFVSALVTTLLYLTENPNVSWLWFSIPLIGSGLMFGYLHRREKPVKTYIDKFISNIWFVIGIVAGLIPLSGLLNWKIYGIVLPAEALILSIGVILTGLTIRFKFLTIGGFAAMLLAFAILVIQQYAVYMFMLMFVVSMIIPGHILNYRGKIQCSKS